MAAPVYATDLTDILTDMASTTGWTALGGGASGLVAPETDFFVQGSNCISKAGWSTAVKGMIYLAGAAVTVPTTGAVFMWIYYWAPNAMDTSSSGGMRFCCGSSASAYYEYTVAGSDKLPFGGWFLSCVDPNTATADFTVGSPSGAEQSFGATIDVPAGGPSKGQPLGIDAFRYGRGTLTCTNGDLANGYATFAGAQAYGDDVTRRWGQLSFRDGSYFMSGFLSLGSSGTAVDFRDSNRVIFIRDHVKVASGFNRIEVMNASTNVDWTNISITALGTNSPGTFVHTAGTFDASLCQFISMGTFTLLSTSVINDSTFRSCGAITAPGSDLRRSKVETANVTADTSAVIWNVATDPDGKLDSMTFTKGTNAHHAIEFGTSSPTTMTLRGLTFTGFNASNAQNDSVLHIKRTTGTVTIYTVSCSGTVSYKSDGATVTIIADPVTTLVNVKNLAGSNIQNANVLLKAANGTGPMPYDVTVTISNSGTTATVTHTTHGMATNDKVVIKGASLQANNGVFSITKISDNSYSYTMGSSPGSSPTGTIKATYVALAGLTDASGNISMSRVFTADQPVIGWARKSSAAPYYKEAAIGGTIDNATGLSASVLMISDE